MSVTINSNPAATLAANNLATNYLQLQKSLDRLSTGSRIVNPSDDAGGLGVSLKLSAAAKRQSAAETNLANSQSLLQTQDGALATAGNVLNRISELKTLASDPTKNSSDIANYDAEFGQLQQELQSIGAGTFNGIALFGTSSLSVDTTGDQSAAGSLAMAGVNLLGVGGGSWNSIGMSPSDWTTGGGATNSGTNAVLGANGTITTNQSNIKGPWTLAFDVINNPASLGSLFFTGSGGTVQSSFMLDTNSHHIVVTDDGSLTKVYVDGVDSGPTNLSVTGSGSSLTIQASGNNMVVSNLTLNNTGTNGNVAGVIAASNLSSLNLSTVTSAIADVAGYRADNGALQSRIGYSAEMLATNKANLEQANSRISDVDVATESGTLAKENVLVQAGTSMLSQANQSAQLALKLLG